MVKLKFRSWKAFSFKPQSHAPITWISFWVLKCFKNFALTLYYIARRCLLVSLTINAWSASKSNILWKRRVSVATSRSFFFCIENLRKSRFVYLHIPCFSDANICWDKVTCIQYDEITNHNFTLMYSHFLSISKDRGILKDKSHDTWFNCNKNTQYSKHDFNILLFFSLWVFQNIFIENFHKMFRFVIRTHGLFSRSIYIIPNDNLADELEKIRDATEKKIANRHKWFRKCIIKYKTWFRLLIVWLNSHTYQPSYCEWTIICYKIAFVINYWHTSCQNFRALCRIKLRGDILK